MSGAVNTVSPSLFITVVPGGTLINCFFDSDSFELSNIISFVSLFNKTPPAGTVTSCSICELSKITSPVSLFVNTAPLGITISFSTSLGIASFTTT